MVATEFTTADGEPDGATASAVLQACLKHNLLLLTCGSYGNVLRWIPPLVVTQAQIDEALTTFNEALATAVGKSN
jgi:4-aminobutyrate aminotransferase